MPLNLLAPLCALLYLTATGLQLLRISQRNLKVGTAVLATGLFAMLVHSWIVWHTVFRTEGISFGFFKVSALIFLVINVACVASMLRRPLQNLLLAIFPLSALSVLVSTFAPDTMSLERNLTAGILLHISSSILAYSVLTLAAIQSAAVALQDHQLRQHHMRGVVQILPPLQLMESMLFELLWIGVILLTIAIVSGMAFVDDLFAQHLVHKTVLTIIAWVLFSTLLWGHYRLGWRSATAVRLTLAGFVVLMLAFFGSKLVLELVLRRR